MSTSDALAKLDEIKEEIGILRQKEWDLGSCRATLLVNFGKDATRPLVDYKLDDIKANGEIKTTNDMLFEILVYLSDQLELKRKLE